MWEAVHILDALIKNVSKIQPDIPHADTHGQSEPVFGLCRLLAIELMPRMRGISDAVFYRPGRSFRYQHIDALFTGTIDWDLIAAHADDMFQVALSIQAGARHATGSFGSSPHDGVDCLLSMFGEVLEERV